MAQLSRASGPGTQEHRDSELDSSGSSCYAVPSGSHTGPVQRRRGQTRYRPVTNNNNKPFQLQWARRDDSPLLHSGWHRRSLSRLCRTRGFFQILRTAPAVPAAAAARAVTVTVTRQSW